MRLNCLAKKKWFWNIVFVRTLWDIFEFPIAAHRHRKR